MGTDLIKGAFDAPDSRYLECSLFRWDLNSRHCRACNRDLTGRRRTWCSQKCEGTYQDNHFWSEAAKARKKLDDYLCCRCGVRSEPRLTRWEWWNAHKQGTAITRDRANKLLTGPALEVHHLWARWRYRGQDSSGCHHHLSLLITVCRPCHVRLTKEENRRIKLRRFVQQHPHLHEQARLAV